MSFRRYEIILPTRHNDGSPVQEENHLWVGSNWRLSLARIF